MSDISRSWIFRNRPNGLPTSSGPQPTFELTTTKLPSLKDNQVLVRTLYLSNDPAQRGWLEDVPLDRSYVPPVQLNTPMRAFGVGKVTESKASHLKPGTIVQAALGWNEYVVLNAGDCTPRTTPTPQVVSVTNYLGALGGNGITAYYGLVEIGQVKAGQRIVVSGAAGATGSMVVQIAKHLLGCSEVIGIAGSEEKCRWIESLGADTCLNYKHAEFYDELATATKGFVDVFYDNVGGNILDFMLTRLKQNGTVVACGGIAGYNSGGGIKLQNYMDIIHMRLSIRGFIVIDYLDKAQGTIEILVKAIEDGKIKVRECEQVVPSRFEDIPETWLKLFEGGNTGKLITEIV
ncbi:hypothetical protein PV08_02275 [Exophiala spinifera]|uniref:Enoyl reductase (ER) domain-containing protein n=1 Tax=Exophiala spinifera TaxID=91928 RepID=A0A0D2C318_9EURO|nr:uncharacterized protein PV08_02275 [Exophiala spinifera]KIW17989.1 hypothetical protein PV08_02275 [Exophiala spinifera]